MGNLGTRFLRKVLKVRMVDMNSPNYSLNLSLTYLFNKNCQESTEKSSKFAIKF
jgi:hypothetical protein